MHQSHDLLHALHLMYRKGAHPPKPLIAQLLQLCLTNHDTKRTRHAHELLISSGLDSVSPLAENIIKSFSSTGSLLEASLSFCRIKKPRCRTWHAVLSAHVSHGRSSEALLLYEEMQGCGIESDRFLYMSGLRACADSEAMENGKILHHQVLKTDLDRDHTVANTLMHMYYRCGGIDEAHKVFDLLAERDIFSWGAMIGGSVHQGDNYHALQLFHKMLQCNMQPNKVVLLSTVMACGDDGTVDIGKYIHNEVVRLGLECDEELETALVDLYVKCGYLHEANKVFKNMKTKSVISWCALIVGVAQNGDNSLAFELFERMQHEGVKPNEYVYSGMLNVCGCVGVLVKGKFLHDEVIKIGLDGDEFVGNGLVGMYAHCGELKAAQEIFTKLSKRTLVTWSIMMAKNVEHGFSLCALELFMEMKHSGIHPNKAIFSSVLIASANLGALEQGMLLHHEIMKNVLEIDEVVTTSLVDMYARCGCMEAAYKALLNLPNKYPAPWGVLIAGYSHQGNINMVKKCLNDMIELHVEPNSLIYTNVLSACNRAGNVEDGRFFFKSMTEDHNIRPTVHHVHCMINLLGCVGKIEEAIKILQNFPAEGDVSGWVSLLTACRVHGDVELGQQCFDEIIVRDSTNSGAYVMMLAMYADAGLWDAFYNLQQLKRLSVEVEIE